MPETDQLFIPKRIKIGFQKRDDTYTGKLAYVVYFDQKGILRKAVSWEGWRDKKIPPVEYENVPTSGFVLNKKAGGERYSWNQRQTYSRVYDPRGFEFEITVENLLFILTECDCSKGKGLEGEFVYAWNKKDIVLLPVSSEDYKKSQEYTKLRSKSIGVKDLTEGCVYINTQMEKFVYIGKYTYFDRSRYWRENEPILSYIFLPIDGNKGDINETYVYEHGGEYTKVNERNWLYTKSLSCFRAKVSDTPVDNFNFLVDDYLKSRFVSEFDHIEYIDIEKHDLNDQWFKYPVYRDGKKYELIIHRPYRIGLSAISGVSYILKEYDSRGRTHRSKQIEVSKDDLLKYYKKKVLVLKNSSKIIITG